MKICLFFLSEPSSGGAYQYQLTFLEVLKKLKKHEISVITTNRQIADIYRNDFQILNFSFYSQLLTNVSSIFRRISQSKKAVSFSEYDDAAEKDVKSSRDLINKASTLKLKINCHLLHILMKIYKIELIIYPSPSDISFNLNIPYIFTVYDLQHRINPQFPEVSKNGEFEIREYLYSNALPKASAIIADSQVGKEDIINLYNINPDKIFVLQYLPPIYLRNKITSDESNKVRKKYDLPSEYIFYPANFWLHKNHQLIIKAIEILKKRNVYINAVFTGSNHGEYKNLMELARKLNVSAQIYYIGRVNNEEMSALYKLSFGLVMPTFFGPSNIPYLEAFYLDCPVITSNLRGIRDQVQDAALLIDPESPEDLASTILQLKDKKLRETLINNGHKILGNWTYDDFSTELTNILKKFEFKLRNSNVKI